MPRMPAIKKIILSFFVFLLLTFSFVPYVRAQDSTWYNQSFDEWFTKVNESPPNEIFGERYTAAQVQWILYSLVSLLIPNKVVECKEVSMQECFSLLNDFLKNSSTGEQGRLFQNPILAVAALNDQILRTAPVSGTNYVQDLAKNLNLIPEARAQDNTGFGFTTFQPALVLWRASRNVAYFLLTIAIVVVAFMIMFRVKLSPQTVISIQSALPKIVITMVLITFSYAIAGFVFDIMQVALGLIALFLKISNISSFTTTQLIQAIFNQNIVGMIGSYAMVSLVLALGFGGLSLFAGPAAFIGLGAALLLGLFAIVLFIALVRVLWMFLKTYVTILFLIILGPFQILLGVITNTSGFGAWLRSLAANLAVFPVAGFMMVLAHIFFWGSISTGIVGAELAKWDAINPFGINIALEGQFNIPLLGTALVPSLLWMGPLIGFVIIILIPSAANMIKETLQNRPFSMGTAIGQAFGPLAPVGALGRDAAARYGLVEVISALERSERFKQIQSQSRLWGEINKLLVSAKSSLTKPRA